ncbi:MAG: T9SS type A sorting domain-containing protein [Bacteroidetes bacterium]|nr:T9SS type A sorting domain-containing protein [Bacteroidota bacterium]HET6243457.1 T9SS type A sorting domain-containing protein [Bacteroidia bacterium]
MKCNCIFSLIFLFASGVYAQHTISVNVGTVLNNVSNHPVGINMNHLMDDSFLSPTPAKSTTQALQDMGVKFLRYPGGEKADSYFWSVSPWDKPRPTATRPGSCEWPSGESRWMNTDWKTYKALTLDFDEFMIMCNAVGAQPLIVVPYDCMYKAASCGTIPTKAQLIKNAQEWVKYANIIKGHKIKYWMIGNESYNCAYNGCVTASQYGTDVIEFSQALKAIDPSIKIIANGEKSTWWQTVLPLAAAHIDYLGVSSYPAYQYTGGYDYYRTRTPSLTGAVNTAANSINQYAPVSERNRIKVLVTEFNSMDWSGQWPNNNDLGHALVAFEILGEQLKHPKVEGSFFWNTRWINNSTQPYHIYDALNKNGGFNANGIAMSLWGKFLLQSMVQSSGTTQTRSFASHHQANNKLNVFIINKERSAQTVNLSISGFISNASGKRWEMKGTADSDVSPSFTQNGTVTLNGTSATLSLPALSVTVLELSSPSTTTLAPPIAVNKERCGSGTLLLTATGGINYRWYKNFTGGNLLFTGANYTTPIINQTDSFYVANFDGANESIRTKVKAIINPIPSAPQSFGAECCGPGSLTLSSLGASNPNWYENNTTTNSINSGPVFTTPVLNSSTTYYVSDFNGKCYSLRSPALARILEIPAKPEIILINGNTLHCSEPGIVYEWSFNGVVLPNNSQEITVNDAGIYTVRVQSNNTCFSELSDNYNMTTTGIVKAVATEMKLYPNPNNGNFTVKIPEDNPGSEIYLSDLGGKVIYSAILKPGTREKHIKLVNPASGIYFLTLNSGGSISIKKININTSL